MNVRPSQQPAPEPSRPAISATAKLAKCGVCVAALAALALIGVSSIGDGAATDPPVSEAGRATAVVIAGDRAAAHRRQVFEERRARLDARAPSYVVGADLGTAYPYP